MSNEIMRALEAVYLTESGEISPTSIGDEVRLQTLFTCLKLSSEEVKSSSEVRVVTAFSSSWSWSLSPFRRFRLSMCHVWC